MWVYLAQIGFIAYVAFLVLLIVKGIKPDGTLRGRLAARYAALAMASFALWIIGLWRA